MKKTRLGTLYKNKSYEKMWKCVEDTELEIIHLISGKLWIRFILSFNNSLLPSLFVDKWLGKLTDVSVKLILDDIYSSG